MPKVIHTWTDGKMDPCKVCGRCAMQEGMGFPTECLGPITKEQAGLRLTESVCNILDGHIKGLVKRCPGVTEADVYAEFVHEASVRYKESK